LKSKGYGHGGARPGSGKPKGTRWPSSLRKEEAREKVRELITAHLPALVDAQVHHAKGIKHIFLRREDGTFERSDDPDKILAALNSGDETSYYIFTKDPSVQAFTDLMNRAIDKPKEQPQELNANIDFPRLDELLDAWKRKPR
jgi:hypothetical protein